MGKAAIRAKPKPGKAVKRKSSGKPMNKQANEPKPIVKTAKTTKAAKHYKVEKTIPKPIYRSDVRISRKDRAGETFKFFNNTYRLYMIANATDQKLIDNFVMRRSMFGIPESTSVNAHITTMHIHINADNPDHKLLVTDDGKPDPIFRKMMERKYYDLSPSIYLRSSKNRYDIMGEFLAKVYTHDGDVQDITEFRMALYLYLQIYLGTDYYRQRQEIDGRVFYVYSYNGRELIAVPEYYHGKGEWTPHMSIVKLGQIEKYNPKLYDLYDETDDSRVLVDQMRGIPGSIDSLNMAMHFARFTISTTLVK